MNPLDDPLAGPGPEPTPSPPGSATPRVGRWPEPGAPQFRWGEPQPVFAPGAVLAGRYRVLRFIAKGGMGEVYEAEDLELRERVALKTVRPEVAQNEGTVERFKREIHLSRRVTHPNVCRIFDLGVHHAGPEEVLFLTMELLEGETLAQRFKRAGRLPPPEAQKLVRQIAEALDAAHRAGVIHRDLKSANVMLVPTGARRAAGGELRAGTEPAAPEVRAVVTDFGLARSSFAEDASGSLTGSAMFVGTPAYLAPEQLEGKKATAAADIYSLGVVMYEMFTGVRPFASDTPMAMLTRRLQEAPAPPHKHVPTLDARWEARILRCLERDPENRFQSAAELLRDLDAVAAQPQPQSQPRAGRWLMPAAAGLILLAGAAFYLLARRPPDRVLGREDQAQAPVAAAAKGRRSIAVLGFKNLSGRPESNWLSTALSEMLSTELAAGEHLRIIPQENVVRMKSDLALTDAESFSGETLGRIGAHLGAELVVVGSYLALGGEGGPIRMDLRLQDTGAGETLDVSAETGTEAQLFALVSRMGARLRQAIGVPVLRPDELAQVQASLAAQPESMRLYAEGVRKLQLFDAAGAREALERAVAADPGNPLAHTALASAWSELGDQAKAAAAAERAFKLSEGLSRQERFWVEARYHEIAGHRDKAMEIYRTLFSYFSDNVDYGLRLAAAQTAAGEGKAALATLAELVSRSALARDDPRIDLAEALAAGATADHGRQLAAARKAAEKAQALGARRLVADAKITAWKALLNLNDLPSAKAALEEARQIYAAAGDRQGLLRALTSLGRGQGAGGTIVFPRDGAFVPLTDGIQAFFAGPIDPATLGPELFRLAEAGPDGACGTADDAGLTEAVREYHAEIQAAFLSLPALLPPGKRYCAELGPGIADPAGKSVPAAGRWSFFVYDAAGFPGSALAFDGGDFVEVPAAPGLNPGATFTLEAWVKLEPPLEPQIGLAGSWDDLSGSKRSYAIWLLDAKPELLVASPDGNFTRVGAPRPLPAGSWHHIAGTADGTQAKLYVDGHLEAVDTFTGPIAGNTQPFYIGRTDTGSNGSDFLRGAVDEVRLWSVARTQQQIQESMRGPVRGNEPGLVACWSFADTGSLLVSDLSENRHHGTLGGARPEQRPVWVLSGVPGQATGGP